MKFLIHIAVSMFAVWVFSVIGWIQYGRLSEFGLLLATIIFSLIVAGIVQIVSLMRMGLMWISKKLAYAMAILLPLIGGWASIWLFDYLFGVPITIESWWSGFIMATVMIFLSIIKK